MSLKLNLSALALLFCLNPVQVLAQTPPPLVPVPILSFNLPKNIKNSKPHLSLKEIQQKIKKGEIKYTPSLGGMDGGGGGKILLCQEKDGIRATVLDVYEGEQAGRRIDLGNGRTLDEKINYVLNRLEKVAPVHARAYAQWIHDLLETESIFYENPTMPVTDDIGLTVIPANCEKVQVVVQRNAEEAEIPGLARYLFDRDIFIQLDLDSQVALIFHEVIYREARLRGEKDSLRSRYLNSLILSTDMETMTMEAFNQVLKKLKSKCLEFPGITGSYGCELPPVFAQQKITWKGLTLEGLFSVAINESNEIHSIKLKDMIFDLTNIAKTLNPSFQFELKISSLPKHSNILYLSNGPRVETSDLVNIDAKSFRATVSGQCLVMLNSHATQWAEAEHYLYCPEVLVIQDGLAHQFTDTRYILFKKDGSVEVRKK